MSDKELPAQFMAGVEHVSYLGKPEGDRTVRPDGRAHDPARVSVHP